jgi:hypothetical protein
VHFKKVYIYSNLVYIIKVVVIELVSETETMTVIWGFNYIFILGQFLTRKHTGRLRHSGKGGGGGSGCQCAVWLPS